MNQLPFTSINYGTCTLEEGRMVTKAILENSISGNGKYHRTSIFPCGIFQYMKGVNDKPGTPNYDLYRLALQSTSKRLYPNYVNCEWSGNKGYDRNNPDEYASTMGALSEFEHLYVKIDDKDPIDISIKDFFNYCNTGVLENYRTAQIFFNRQNINAIGTKNKMIKNTNIDHKPGVYSITYLPENLVYYGSSSDISRRLNEHKYHIRNYGSLDSGVYFNDCNLQNYSFDVMEYLDDYINLENECIRDNPNINFKGTSQRYYKLMTYTKLIKERPVLTQDHSILPQLIGLTDKNIKVLDKDNKWVRVKAIFKNDKNNSPLMMHIHYNEYGKEYCLSCTEDHPLWNGKDFIRADQLTLNDKLYRADDLPLDITNISWHWCKVDSYDIETESGTFIGSDIIMHNCRTFIGYDINGLGYSKIGRGNAAPVTIILPTLAMEANRDVDKFFEILDKTLDEAKDMLLERYYWICNQSPESAQFMYENNSIAGYIPEEGIESAMKHMTLALG